MKDIRHQVWIYYLVVALVAAYWTYLVGTGLYTGVILPVVRFLGGGL